MTRKSTLTAKSAWSGTPDPGIDSYPSYPLPASTVLRILTAVILKKRRSFHRDSRKMIAPVPLQISGKEWIPSSGGVLLTINHYARPGFGIWWAIAAISARISTEIYWLMTSNWNYPGQKRDRFLRPISHFAFDAISKVYGFATMPPMPPDPRQVEERLVSVRKVMRSIRHSPSIVVGLSPEGMDFPSGILGWPPPGNGRFVYHMVNQGLEIVPVGIFEANGSLCINYGPHYKPVPKNDLSPTELDHAVSQIVMSHIATLLPNSLRGDF